MTFDRPAPPEDATAEAPAADSEETLSPHEAAAEVVERMRDGVQDDKERKKTTRSFWKELPILVVIALIVAIVIKTFFIQAFSIPSGSMRDTLLEGDRVMVNKLAYRFGDPAHGDVVVFDSPFNDEGNGESIPAAIVRNIGEALGIAPPAREFIKRIIAVEGDTLEIRNNQMWLNGEVLDEPYIQPGTLMRDMPRRTIPDGTVFVMGDNRNNSQDSRFFDEIPVEDIVGRAFVRVWPPSRWGGL